MRRRRTPKDGDHARLARAGESPWLVRLRFVCISLAFAACWWATYQQVEGRVSFAWLSAIGAQVQSVTASLRSTPSQPRIAAAAQATRPALTARSSAQVVPTPTIAPLALPPTTPAPTAAATATAEPAAPVIVLAPTATPIAARETPAPSATPSGLRPTATAPAVDPNGPHTIYVIRAGDTLYGIARRYGIPWSTLAEFNHLQPPYKLVQGAHLNIPES